MISKNAYLQKAKNTKDDEFYTTYETVESEVVHYATHFAGKTVLCNCDDPFESNFCRYFLKNFNVLGLRRLICTSYSGSNVIGTQFSFFDDYQEIVDNSFGYVLDVTKFSERNGVIPDNEIEDFLNKGDTIHRLIGNGDFSSRECQAYMKIADIIVTNPPFSMFREFLTQILRYGKKFLIIGNQNAITYKEIFPLIQNNQVWTGYKFGEMKFRVPASSEPHKYRYWVDEDGQKWRSLGNAMWLTNLDNDRRHELILMTKSYNSEDYPKYDDYDAINVKTIRDIPYDYYGVMGVPITFINRYNSEQFEIIGEANHGSDNEFDLFKPTINGKAVFKRILIRRRR